MKFAVSSHMHNLLDFMKKVSAADEGGDLATDPAIIPDVSTPSETPVEEKDQDTLLSEHVKNNIDKYRKSFEALFPKTQMVAKNVEYHGAVDANKIRLMVEFETPMLNFDALGIMSNKDIGIEATGEKTFRVYNIYLPKVKDPSIK
jgi:hypothetical protein